MVSPSSGACAWLGARRKDPGEQGIWRVPWRIHGSFPWQMGHAGCVTSEGKVRTTQGVVRCRGQVVGRDSY